jgi:flavin reductase (DIM6/NTAB) family NADH-FMN oxidoreductase RutF
MYRLGDQADHCIFPEFLMRKKTFPLSQVYRLLEPGPVVMVTTALKGRANIMTMSWHTMMEFEPPLVGCVISDRNHTFGILKATRECVINIPAVELAAKAVGCGNTTGRDINKFKVFRLTAEPASLVAAPLIVAHEVISRGENRGNLIMRQK